MIIILLHCYDDLTTKFRKFPNKDTRLIVRCRMTVISKVLPKSSLTGFLNTPKTVYVIIMRAFRALLLQVRLIIEHSALY